MTDTAQTVPAEAGDDKTPVVQGVETPAEKQDQATPAEAAEPQTESGKSEAETSDKSDAKRNSIKERIDRERSKRMVAEDRARAAETRAQRLEDQLKDFGKHYENLDPTDPRRHTLDTHAASKMTARDLAYAERDEANREARQSQAQLFHAKVDDARDRLPDLDAAVETFGKLMFSDEACEEIAESDKAAEIAYFLAKNPTEAYRILALPPTKQASAIARLETRVTAAPARKPSNAPPPVRTNLGGGSSPTAKTLSQMTTEEYVAHRRAEMAKGS